MQRKLSSTLIDIAGTDKSFCLAAWQSTFKELGIDAKNSKELITAKRSSYVLGNFLKDLNNIDSLEDVNI